MTLPGFPPANGAGRGSSGGHREQRHPPRSAPPGPSSPPTHGRGHEPIAQPSDTRETSEPKVSLTRVAATRTKELTRKTVHRIDAASRADGAEKSGLRTLLWSNATSMAGDALIAVWLAASLFFAAPGEQQRGNVALYLLVTVAPFAVIAPVIGPLLDRIDRGRRWALAGTFAFRALLCYLLVAYSGSMVMLYVCALLCLVFSRAYGVLRGAVVPRVLPDKMPLVTANSRMTVFGMVTAGVIGGIGAGLIKLFNWFEPAQPATQAGTTADATLGFNAELVFTLLVFLVGAWISLKLPSHVDTDEGEGKINLTKRPGGVAKGRFLLGTDITTALRSQASQKFLGGFLTFFMVFYIQSTLTGFVALAALGALGAAAGVGSILGTGVGSRIKGASPDNIALISTGIAVALCVLAAITPGIALSIVVALLAAIASALGKVALDAIIQREVPPSFASSAFSRSETVLQLAWVFGGAVGIILPAHAGMLWLGWTVAAAVLVITFALTLISRHRAHQLGPLQAGISDRPPIRLRVSWPFNKSASKKSQADVTTDDSASGGPAPGGGVAGPHPSSPRAHPAANNGQSDGARPSSSGRPSTAEWQSAPAPASPTRPLPDFQRLPTPKNDPRRGPHR
ncbi:putative MFS family arabinose efflux permease [Antricoccus suffuscus]|uniref:Putative MFS family arabinose efflux permease n=1 Tax=Antricoccus suffuscus TaxID=1629062 RepID=A0A2T0ZY09_9ACTN|nr:MFS transporter [Antricoccus suffuscus]PRZ41127.1 putative MFS family arabinose efflux permease [Antricoccus suffuscus]